MGEKNEVRLSKMDIELATLRWWLLSHMAYNYQRMQAGGFASMMEPLLKSCIRTTPKR